MKRIWKRVLTACCTFTLLMNTSGTLVLADEAVMTEVVEITAPDTMTQLEDSVDKVGRTKSGESADLDVDVEDITDMAESADIDDLQEIDNSDETVDQLESDEIDNSDETVDQLESDEIDNSDETVDQLESDEINNSAETDNSDERGDSTKSDNSYETADPTDSANPTDDNTEKIALDEAFSSDETPPSDEAAETAQTTETPSKDTTEAAQTTDTSADTASTNSPNETKISIENASVAGVSYSYGYRGRAYTPEFTVSVKGVTLEAGTDYTYTFHDNVNPGTALIRITGIGKYTGLRVKDFEIVDCASEIVSGKTYQMIPKNNSATAVCAYSGRMVNNTKVYITNRGDSEAMRFKAVQNSDGTWKFINAKSEQVLAVQQNSSALGAGIVLYEQTSRKAQRWELVKKYDNSFAIINAVTGYSMSMSHPLAPKGTTLSMAETERVGLQRFYIAETDAVDAAFDGTYAVKAAKNSKFSLGVSSAEDDANVNLCTYSNTNAKKFKVLYSGYGHYRLMNVNSGLVLTVKENSEADGANVIQSKWAGESGQRWKIRKNSDGTVTFVNALGTVLHLTGNKTQNGTNVAARKAAATSAQRGYLG